MKIILKIHTAIQFSDTPAVQVPPSGAEADKEAATEKTAPKKGLKLTYDEYKQMANLLVCHMRKMEETPDGEDLLMVRRWWQGYDIYLVGGCWITMFRIDTLKTDVWDTYM